MEWIFFWCCSFFLKNSSSKIYKKEKEEEEEDEEDLDEVVNITKSGKLFYSPPKTRHLPPEPRSRLNTNDSTSSTADLIIPEEGSDLRVLEQPEGKYSSRDARHGTRHKHKRHERPLKRGGEFFNWGDLSIRKKLSIPKLVCAVNFEQSHKLMAIPSDVMVVLLACV